MPRLGWLPCTGSQLNGLASASTKTGDDRDNSFALSDRIEFY
jgi:hypothetical protein